MSNEIVYKYLNTAKEDENRTRQRKQDLLEIIDI